VASPQHYVLFTDGGSRGNPGPAGVGVALLTADGTEVFGAGRFLGDTTNNVAEYSALIWGLEIAAAHGATTLEVRADSELVIKQMKGLYRVKHPNLQPLYAQARGLADELGRTTFTHVPRSQNKRADELANLAMDARRAVGDVLDPDMLCSGSQDRLFGDDI